MSFSMNLWKVKGDSLEEIEKQVLDKEQRLENWIEKDPTILGLDLLIIGRQVSTENRGRIDILAMNIDGDVVIVIVSERILIQKLQDFGRNPATDQFPLRERFK